MGLRSCAFPFVTQPLVMFKEELCPLCLNSICWWGRDFLTLPVGSCLLHLFFALYLICKLPFVYDLSHSEDFDSSFCATWLALTHGFWLPLLQFLKAVILSDPKGCWSQAGTSSEVSHWMSMHPPQYCKYSPVNCPWALLALVFKLSTHLKRTWRMCRMKSLQCVNYTIEFNLGKGITSENGHWFT